MSTINPLIFIFVAVFALSFVAGAITLLFYNQFSRKQAQIAEAEKNISLFLSKRRENLEALQPLVDKLDLATSKDIHHLLQLARGTTQSNGELPGRSQTLVEADRLTQKILHYLRQHGANAQIQHILDLFERSEIELNGSKRYYNALVREYNTMTSSFPSAIVALLFKFKAKDYLSADQA